MIPLTDSNIRRIVRATNHLDALLSVRGLPPLTADQRDSLYCADLEGAFALLQELEACHGLCVDPVREILTVCLPPQVQRHIFEGETV